MAKILSMFVMTIAMLIVGTLFQGSAAQTMHNLDWRVPSSDADGYHNWASKQSFIAGDKLVFNFVNGTHDVLQVTKAEFDSCSASNPLKSMTVAPVEIQLTYPGHGYFICSSPGHCEAGQRLAIEVKIPSTDPASSQHQSSASSMSAIAIPVVLFFFAIGALFH